MIGKVGRLHSLYSAKPGFIRYNLQKKRRFSMKKILFAASECVPFVKTGGLADVVGSLPQAFDKNEFDIRVIIPC